MKLTDELREASGSQWDRVINHKFTDELAKGTIDRKVLSRYLIQDHRFLDAFVVLLSSIIANARCLQDRIPGCQFLALITGSSPSQFKNTHNSAFLTPIKTLLLMNERKGKHIL